MNYLFDIGSMTVKMYLRDHGIVKLIRTKSFDFGQKFTPGVGLPDEKREQLFAYFEELEKEYHLTRSNTKIFATGIFREIEQWKLVRDFYVRTHLFFNIIPHDLEAFYIENARKASCKMESILVVNIGGRTTELLGYQSGMLVEKHMLNVGAGTILEKYPEINQEYSMVSLKDVIDFILPRLPFIEYSYETSVYTGGELSFMRSAGYPLKGDRVQTICLEEYSSYNQKLFSELSLKELYSFKPDDPKWMNGARSCSALAQAIFMRCGVKTICPSDFDLIDGVNIQEVRNVVICGSFNKHLDKIANLMDRLKNRNIDILSPKNLRVIGAENSFILFENDNIINNCTWSIEALHMQAIEQCDAVIICNFDNYIGRATAAEIGYALSHSKKIIFIEDNDVAYEFDIPSEINML